MVWASLLYNSSLRSKNSIVLSVWATLTAASSSNEVACQFIGIATGTTWIGHLGDGQHAYE